MSEKTVVTCDHCGEEVENMMKSRFTVIPTNALYGMPSVDACSREHLGIALAKMFGIGVNGEADELLNRKQRELTKLTDANSFLITERDNMRARIAELEARMPANEVTNAERVQYETTIELQRKRIAELEKRIAELTEPMTVDGKTPGQVANEGYERAAGSRTESWEACAQAVLRAFGNPPSGQTPQTNAVEVLRRVRDKLCNQPAFNLVFGMEYVTITQLRKVFDDEIAKLEAKPVGKAPECFLCGKGPHDHTMMVLESLPEQFEVKWCNGRRQNFGTEKPAWWDVPKSDHVHELKSCSCCDKSPPDTSTESGLPDAVLVAITLPTKPTKPLRERLASLLARWATEAKNQEDHGEECREMIDCCVAELQSTIDGVDWS